jgi:tripartite-type tricarboxylate transporter receptor subunit TctC
MSNAFTRRAALGLAASLALVSALPAHADAWKPMKPVEMVIMAGQGGGADRLARLFQAIIQEGRMASMPVVPVNKGGGSGAEALRYLADKDGDAHTIMATLNSYYTTPLRTNIGVDIAEFTPIARMAVDTFVIWVNADSDIQTLDDYVAAVKAAGGNWKMGGTGTGQEDSLVSAMLEQRFGIKFTYVPFGGGGEVAKNLVGNHVQSTVNNPSEAMGFYKAGKVRPIAALTEARIPALADVPTMAEPLLHGLHSETGYWLAITGTRRMQDSAAPFNWTRVFVTGRYAGIRPMLGPCTHAVYRVIEETFAMRVARIAQVVRACNCPNEAAPLLGLSTSDPVLNIRARLYDGADGLIEVSDAYYDPAKFSVRTDVRLSG